MSIPAWNWCYPLPDGTDLVQRLLQAEQTIREMTERVRKLESSLEEVRSRSPMHIEYHFDQLKVSELKGTLNVGLSPQGVQGMDSLEVPPAYWQAPPPPDSGVPQPVSALQQQMMDYMDREAPLVLAEMEKQYGAPLGDDLRGRVLQDVKAQLRERVHYYAKTLPYPENGTEEERRRWGGTIVEKTKRDIDAAFAAYLNMRRSKSEFGGGDAP
ncbi:spore germination protein GerPC [Cohnella caldifontis]|uniref:spore germination protein GerPC n=1 Tax=Cohnella caldifontis TaxID=3027471 RepID=UPI0023EB4632|nr:spore germination protein GerPC [Cohnella sp. YIM B05605]